MQFCCRSVRGVRSDLHSSACGRRSGADCVSGAWVRGRRLMAAASRSTSEDRRWPSSWTAPRRSIRSRESSTDPSGEERAHEPKNLINLRARCPQMVTSCAGRRAGLAGGGWRLLCRVRAVRGWPCLDVSDNEAHTGDLCAGSIGGCDWSPDSVYDIHVFIINSLYISLKCSLFC